MSGRNLWKSNVFALHSESVINIKPFIVLTLVLHRMEFDGLWARNDKGGDEIDHG
jgi:hypothetical protein